MEKAIAHAIVSAAIALGVFAVVSAYVNPLAGATAMFITIGLCFIHGTKTGYI